MRVAALGPLRRGGQGVVEDAADQAGLGDERLSSYSYQTVKNILAAGLEVSSLEEPVGAEPTFLPGHENIRGAGYHEKEN